MTGLDQQFVRNSNYTIVLITGPCLIMVGALEHETFSLQSLQNMNVNRLLTRHGEAGRICLATDMLNGICFVLAFCVNRSS